MAEQSDTVTGWLAQLQAGDRGAAQKIWERYYARLVTLARARLAGRPRRVADEEDVALSAFKSFFRGVEAGRFPELHDRDNLWAVLVRLTANAANDHARREGRQKRGGGKVAGESAFADSGIARAADREPTPDEVVALSDLCEALLKRLDDPSLRQVALMKLEGYTNAEIARAAGVIEKTVERRLRLIRKRWDVFRP